MLRIIRYTIAGVIGAVIAWAIMEPTSLMPNNAQSISYAAIFIVGFLSGFLIGLMLGVSEAAASLSPKTAVKSILMGALIGGVGGVVGITLGNNFYNIMCQLGSTHSFLSFMLLLIGRGFGWALIGAFIGLSQGIASGSTKKMINGFIGGFIGGGAGGSTFEILAWMNKGGVSNFPPAMIRFLSFSLTGAGIGFFIGLIEELAKKAWIIKLVGKNEGKEYTLFKPVSVIGRSEFSDIPIFGDPDVTERHAVIAVQGNRYVVEDAGSAFGTFVNNSKIAKGVLTDGDIIMVGKTKLLFKDKASARFSKGVSQSYDQTPHIPTTANVCQFCGAIKDVNGNCQCSLTSPKSQPQMPSYTPYEQASQPTNMNQGQTLSSSAPSKITGVSGPYAGQIFILSPGENLIGREASLQIPLSLDNTVSRNHSKIVLEGSGYILYDDNSTNGTYVNGMKITRHQLTNADVIQIGSTKFSVEL